jgi:phosphoglycolate phosphatase-like HAD superfamily hydrolase
MIIITDIDGTLAQSSWRDNLKGNWEEYHAASKDDQPNKAMVELLNELSEGIRIVCITTRPERWRGLTNKWLIRHWIKIPEMIMRPNDDFRPSPALKAALAETYHLCSKDQKVLAFDDRADVRAAYRALGFFTVELPW